MKIDYHKELEKVLAIVRKHPEGRTIKEISREIGINRNAVAKYLDILRVAGHVEMKRIGPAKVYYPSKFVPISMLFDFSEELIVIVDENLVTVEVNSPLLRHIDVTSKEEVIGKPISKLPIVGSFPKMVENIRYVFGKHHVLEDEIIRNDGDSDPEKYRVKFVPTTLNNGKRGVALLIRKENA